MQRLFNDQKNSLPRPPGLPKHPQSQRQKQSKDFAARNELAKMLHQNQFFASNDAQRQIAQVTYSNLLIPASAHVATSNLQSHGTLAEIKKQHEDKLNEKIRQLKAFDDQVAKREQEILKEFGSTQELSSDSDSDSPASDSDEDDHTPGYLLIQKNSKTSEITPKATVRAGF